MHMFYDGGFSVGGMHGFWWIFWILLFGVIAAYAWRSPGDQRHRWRETPHEALQRRLANGKVTPDDYEKRKVLLDRDSDAKT